MLALVASAAYMAIPTEGNIVHHIIISHSSRALPVLRNMASKKMRGRISIDSKRKREGHSLRGPNLRTDKCQIKVSIGSPDAIKSKVCYRNCASKQLSV